MYNNKWIKPTQENVNDWIKFQATGAFRYREVLDGLVRPDDFPKLRVYCKRAVEGNIASRLDGKDGWFRPIDAGYEEIILDGQDIKEDPLLLPMEMHRYSYTFKPALILVSGEWNKGKTAYCFDLAYLNCEAYKTVMYVSEGAELMKMRVKNKYGYVPSPMPFTMRRKTHNFADIINDEFDLFIIDYLRPDMEKSYAVANELSAIYAKLGKDKVAVVAMQKHIGGDMAYGGQPTQWEPTLSIAIGNGYAKFTKIKVPKIFDPDPYSIKFTFKIQKGVNFINVAEVIDGS